MNSWFCAKIGAVATAVAIGVSVVKGPDAGTTKGVCLSSIGLSFIDQ